MIRELTATILAYEIARADGEIFRIRTFIINEEIEKISAKVGKIKMRILKIVEKFSKNSVFHFMNLLKILIKIIQKKKSKT